MTYNTTTTTSIFSVPKPVSEDHITQYIRIRLAALKTNPEAFGSTYAVESTFSREQWRGRIDNPARTTLFAVTEPSSAIGDGSLERNTGSQYDDHESEWIGTLSVLGPEMLHGEPFPPKLAKAEERGYAEIYMLTGMWVHPEFRKKGVGGQLIEHASQAVRDFSVIDNGQNREGNEGRQKILLLEVNNANSEAQILYESQGFVEELGDIKEGKKWMALNIR